MTLVLDTLTKGINKIFDWFCFLGTFFKSLQPRAISWNGKHLLFDANCIDFLTKQNDCRELQNFFAIVFLKFCGIVKVSLEIDHSVYYLFTKCLNKVNDICGQCLVPVYSPSQEYSLNNKLKNTEWFWEPEIFLLN